MKKEMVVFSQRVAGFLMFNGFVLKKMNQTTKGDSIRNVFLFNDTEELRKKISEYDEFVKTCLKK